MAIPAAAAAIGAGASALGSLSGGISSGGSYQESGSSGWSQTDATSARAYSDLAAETAFQRQKELMKMQMDFNSAEAQKSRDFNSEEAQKGRDWQTEMANTVYTRSVKNMIEAGINPILAANIGLSGASVGSAQTASSMGASASLGNAPLAQNFMDQSSANNSWGHGSSWNSSESGLATGLALLGNAIAGAINNLNSSQSYQDAMNGLMSFMSETKDNVSNSVKDFGRFLNDMVGTDGKVGVQGKYSHGRYTKGSKGNF